MGITRDNLHLSEPIHDPRALRHSPSGAICPDSLDPAIRELLEAAAAPNTRRAYESDLTEPGEKSALRSAIDSRHALPPLVFQKSDAFISLARAAKRELTVLVPFMDDEGADFLLDLFALCGNGVERNLICRPLSEPHCGIAYHRRHADFRRLNVAVYEYALPSKLRSGRETFHAKVVLADDSAFYVGSSNLMGSALERSLECGVIVHGESARQLRCVLQAIRCIASRPF